MSQQWRYHAAIRRRAEKHAQMYGVAPLFHADYSSIEERILAHMSMSRDRVQFELEVARMNDVLRNVFLRAFGVKFPSTAWNEHVVTIVCRPSQFARFLIWRNEADCKNGFKELNAQIIPAEQPKKVLDVSANPARD